LLPMSDEEKVRLLLSRQQAYLSDSNQYNDLSTEVTQLPMSHYLWIIRQQRWKIAAFVGISVLVTYILCSRITPSYEATATIEVDRQIPAGVVGQEASQAALNDVDQFLATQMKIIQSDSVLRPVVERFGLEREGGKTAAGVDSPIALRNLRVTRPPSTYLIQIAYRYPDPVQAASAANEIARSYIAYSYDGRIKSSTRITEFMERQLDELRAKMERSSSALNKFERELNVINPEEKTSILSARLLQLNAEYTAAQADRARKQSAAQNSENGGVDAAQVSAQGEALKVLNDRINEAQEKFAEAKSHFGTNHPEYRKHEAEVEELHRQIDATSKSVMRRIDIEYQQAQKREEILKGAVATTKEEFDKVNARSFEYRSLKEEAEADRKLYDELIRRIKEAGINANFHNNAIRVADPARPSEKPVYPNIPTATFLSLFGSTLFAFAAAIIGDGLNSKVRAGVHLAKLLNTEVIGTLPMMRQPRISATKTVGVAASTTAVAPSRSGEEERRFHEAICVLRSTIALSDIDRRIRSLLITSAMPSEGKTTTALQLSIANAQQGRRTLIIDGDLRRPTVHTRLGINSSVGLADYLNGTKPWRELVQEVPNHANLSAIPAGRAARVIHEVALHNIPKLLDEVAAEYDLVIVDAAPLPGFAEPLEIARAVDGVVVLARAGKTDRRAVLTVLRTLERLHANVLGVVLNEVRFEHQIGYYGYGYGNTAGNAA